MQCNTTMDKGVLSTTPSDLTIMLKSLLFAESRSFETWIMRLSSGNANFMWSNCVWLNKTKTLKLAEPDKYKGWGFFGTCRIHAFPSPFGSGSNGYYGLIEGDLPTDDANVSKKFFSVEDIKAFVVKEGYHFQEIFQISRHEVPSVDDMNQLVTLARERDEETQVRLVIHTRLLRTLIDRTCTY